MKLYNFVYKTINLINGWEYIGVHSTNKLDDGYLGSGVYIRRAVEKYGRQNFTRQILSFHNTLYEAFDREADLVTVDYIWGGNTYNLRTGGCKKQKYKWSDEQKRNLVLNRSYKGSKNPNFGNGYKQSGERNGRHHQNYKGDVRSVGRKISSKLKQSTLNKKENNPASKLYHIKMADGCIVNIKQGYLTRFCIEKEISYNVIFSTLKTGKPISRTKYTNLKGMQLFEGWADDVNEIYG